MTGHVGPHAPPEGRFQQGWAKLQGPSAQRWKMHPGAGNQRPGVGQTGVATYRGDHRWLGL